MSDADNYFGPQVNGYFDFTVLFEQSIMSILPTALLILLAPVRITWLIRNDIRVRAGKLLWLKLVAISVFLCLQIVLIALWSIPSTPRARTSVAESALGLIEAIALGALSYTEHKRSIRPSALIGLYLFLTIVLDIAQARTLWLRDGLTSVAGVFTASLVVKVVVLALEETPKRVLLASSEKDVAVESTTGVVSRSLFWWLNSLFFQGFRLLIGLEDLGAIDPKFDSARLLDMLDRAWATSKKDSKWSLVISTFWAYRTTFLAGVLPRLLFAGFTFAQPLLVNRIVNFVGSPWGEDSRNVAAGLVGATACIYVGLAISRCWYQHMTFQLVTLFRGGLVSLIFKKTLDLDASAIKDSAPVTLMSVDIENIAVSLTFIHDIWPAVVELPIGIYLLYRQVGPPCFLLLIPGLLCTAVTTKLSARMAPARVAWNEGVQKRISITSSLLNQIKGVKMMGLADHFSSIVQKFRITELKLSVKFRVLITFLSVIVGAADQITPVVIIAAAVFWTRAEQGLSIAEAFTALSIIVLVSAPFMKLIVSIIQLVGALGCFTRIQEFLLLDELEDRREILTNSEKSSLDSARLPPSLHGSDLQPLTPRHQVSASNAVELQSLRATTLRPSSIELGKPLVSINEAKFTLKDGTEILRDISLVLKKGSISMLVGRVGCGKSSLLKGILGELVISSGTVTLHTSSVAFCDEAAWLRNISVKDNIIGQVPYDAAWFSAVVRACSLDQDIALFPKAEETLVGTGGVALSGGQKQRVALARAVYSRKKLLLLDDVFSGLDNRTSKAVFQRLLGPNGLLRQAGMTVLLATNHVNFLHAADCITMIEDGTIIRNQIAFDSVPRSVWGHLAQDVKGKELAEDDDHDAEELTEDEAKTIKVEAPIPTNARVTEAQLTRQTGDTEVYRLYFNSIGWRMLAPFIFMIVLYVGFTKLPQVWLRVWTEEGTNERPAMYFGIYLMFALLYLVMNAVSLSFWMLTVVPRSARHLHQMLLDAVLAAPLVFFTTTDSGVTLNRFSQDMTLIDHRLPMSAFATLHTFLLVIAETAIIASGASYFAALIPPSFVALYLLQKYYLRTSRQLRHIDLEAKSPLFTHFTEVLAGLPTLRAFSWRPAMLRESQNLLDASQRPYYLFFCVQRWLNVVLDLFVAGMALCLVAFALHFNNTTTKGAIGLAMVNIISFNRTLAEFIEMWTMLETSLGAITRLKYFIEHTPREDRECEKDTPPPSWPENGKIEIGNVTAAYSDETDPVVRDVTLAIQPGQKVGICGRSGSGKSSLLLTLLRLLDTDPNGTISIDSESLRTMSRNKIRTSLTTLPQDPVLLPGTVRDNIDPAGHTPDADLIDVLRKTRIWDALESRGGLDAEMSKAGLSAGQKQLFCLARAVLKHGQVVLLDEATSNVDYGTDEEVRRVFMEEFKGSTVVEVAHRLEAIVEYDLVVVMHEGRVVEVGDPRELLEKTSRFKGLWDSRAA